jgi:hypothetical protein
VLLIICNDGGVKEREQKWAKMVAADTKGLVKKLNPNYSTTTLCAISA